MASRDPARGADTVAFADGAAFLRWAPTLWDPMGRAAVAAAGLRPGDRVLDACCGAGSSALPAAAVVGPHGHVDAVDLSGPLVELGRARASQAAPGAVTWSVADVTAWPATGYDLILCCYGVFFLDPMDEAVTRLVGLLRPGGRLVVTTWARGSLSAFATLLLDVVRRVDPGIEPPRSGGPAGRVDTPAKLASWLGDVGLSGANVRSLTHRPTLEPAAAWDLVVGTGFRALLPADEGRWGRVRRDFTAALSTAAPDHLDADTLLGTGVRA